MRKPFLQPQQPSKRLVSQASERHILTVTQLNKNTKNLVESQFGDVWLEGEISNFVCAASGHWYFTLKDQNAQIKCALFKFKNQRLKLSPQEGDQVVIKGKVSIYEARGDYQLIADYMEPSGIGALQKELNQLMSKLSAEGLFSPERKQSLPFLPKAIGVITSPTGAAIHDVITVLQRRCPMVPIVIYPTQVQGRDSAINIIKALRLAQQRQECDVLLITRGGGSLEDLWSFNNEALAHEIVNCDIPMVAAVGHEVDLTITELVADLRAATPSAAAELIAPDQIALWQTIDRLSLSLQQLLEKRLYSFQTRLNIARLKLKEPEQALSSAQNRLNKIATELHNGASSVLKVKQQLLQKLSTKLNQLNPKEKLIQNQFKLEGLQQRLVSSIKSNIQSNNNQLSLAANNLNVLSPLSTLARGYSITRDTKSKKIISKMAQAEKNQTLSILLSDGEIDCIVK
jgi:exodeoxyribonuclease VII large subunit